MGWLEGLMEAGLGTAAGARTNLLVKKAAENFQYGRYRQSIRYLDKLIETDPDQPRWLDLKGCCLVKLGRLAEAHTCLEKATRLDPQSGEAWGTRATVLMQMSRWQQALSCLEKALKLSKRVPEVTRAWMWHQKGECQMELGQLQDAISSFDEAVEINSRAETLVKKGLCLHDLGRFDQAIQSYTKALLLSPTNAEGLLFRACSADKLERTEDVIRDLNEFISRAEPGDKRVEIAVARLNSLTRTDRADPPVKNGSILD